MLFPLLEVGEGRSVGILMTACRGKGVLPPFAFEWHFTGLNLTADFKLIKGHLPSLTAFKSLERWA